MSNTDEVKYFRISYLPVQTKPGVIEWVFQGTDKDLYQYLQEYHSCKCEGCHGKNWYDTAQSCEYIIEDITEEFE